MIRNTNHKIYKKIIIYKEIYKNILFLIRIIAYFERGGGIQKESFKK